jgi:MoaA/NifB/PqqE/SkfB family radical SAM enzyme
MALFHHYTALSNWLRGHDRYRGTYSKALIPRSTFNDAFYLLRDGEDQSAGVTKARRLVERVGVQGDRVIRITCELPSEGDGLVARPNMVSGTGVGWRWPRPEVPVSAVAFIEGDGAPLAAHVEDAYALAYRLDDRSLRAWGELSPRSFSVLPVAMACQARCAFCFSKASVSLAAVPAPPDLERVAHAARRAAGAGARRAVITGGGEPGILAGASLTRLIAVLGAALGRATLVTNGAHLSRLAGDARGDALASYEAAGLAVLSLSRHGVDDAASSRIMGLEVDAGAVFAEAARRAPTLRRRLICVLQKGGVHDSASVDAYLEQAVRLGAQEVCFKELYVASLVESRFARERENRYCEEHRVPLAMLVEALDARGYTRLEELPWGSPVLRGDRHGAPLDVAAYTEPSVGWERVLGIARSWNMLSDGRVFASLEDLASEIAIS